MNSYSQRIRFSYANEPVLIVWKQAWLGFRDRHICYGLDIAQTQIICFVEETELSGHITFLSSRFTITTTKHLPYNVYKVKWK